MFESIFISPLFTSPIEKCLTFIDHSRTEIARKFHFEHSVNKNRIKRPENYINHTHKHVFKNFKTNINQNTQLETHPQLGRLLCNAGKFITVWLCTRVTPTRQVGIHVFVHTYKFKYMWYTGSVVILYTNVGSGKFRCCAGLRVFFHLPRIMRMAVRWAGLYCLGFWLGSPHFNKILFIIFCVLIFNWKCHAEIIYYKWLHVDDTC